MDSLLRIYHSGIQSGELAVGQKDALDSLLRRHREEKEERALEKTATPVVAASA